MDAGKALAAAHEVEQRLLRAAVAAGSIGSSRNVPVVLARKMASYCFRFSALMSAGS